MTAKDIQNLDGPKRDIYDEKTWAAINYARAWTLGAGEIEDPEILSAIEKHYNIEERQAILARIRIMNFMNRFFNTWMKPMKR